MCPHWRWGQPRRPLLLLATEVWRRLRWRRPEPRSLVALKTFVFLVKGSEGGALLGMGPDATIGIGKNGLRTRQEDDANLSIYLQKDGS